MANSIYLDNNATTMLLPQVTAAMAACEEAGYANPASQHRAGQQARRVVEQARESIGRILGADLTSRASDRVIFTSGGTEANNLALFGLAGRPPGRIIVSSIEHPSVGQAADELARRGFTIQQLRVSQQGVVDVNHLRELLAPDVRLVSVMLANNETGVLQPVRELAQCCRETGASLHTDAVQVVGKLPVNFQDLGVTALSLSAHKFHGPRGIGALILRSGAKLEPLMFGGFQQQGERPGTESVAMPVGMACALQVWQEEAPARVAQLVRLRARFEQLLEAGAPDLVVHGAEATRLPQTSNLSLPGCPRQALWLALDAAGVYCATGSACSSGSSTASPVLAAMGVSPELLGSALRFSFSCLTTAAEVEEAAERILTAVRDLRNQKERRKKALPSRKQGAKPL